MNYNEGKIILKLIDSNIKELPEAQRQILVDKIVDYFIQNDKKISVSLARTISNQILCLFPDELKVEVLILNFQLHYFLKQFNFRNTISHLRRINPRRVNCWQNIITR